MTNVNVIQALHNILRRESEKPDGKGESIEHAALKEMLNADSPAMLSDDLKQRTKKEYPEKFSGGSQS
jgi:hypothetical protein